jgi:serine/threonine protein kinase
MPLDVGEIVGDRYRVVRLLGQGGMGAVYRAWDTRLNRPVALKEMIPQPGLDDSMLAQLRQQFEQEAQILATLTHPNLVRVTDYFSWDGNEYLVMDFVEGESLADLIEREGAQTEAEVVAWADQLLHALAYCHQQGVLHRDIKPQNIIVTPEGKALLVDFGLVKLWDPGDPETRTVMRGSGTPEYAPPEQYDLGSGHTDPRSDIYGVGATLYQALTGKVPPTATQRMASPDSFVPPRGINAEVSPVTEAAVLKALEIAMDQRFQGAEEMAQALSGGTPLPTNTSARVAWEEESPFSVPESEPGPPDDRRKGRGLLLGLGGVGLALVAVACLAVVAVTVLVGLYIIGRGTDSADLTTPAQPTATWPSTSTPEEAGGSVIFEDDFESSISGWEVGEYDIGDVGYGDGVYFVTSTERASTMWGVARRSFDDLAIEVDATQISAGPDNIAAYGVVCREQGDGDGYYLRISGDGEYSVYRVVGGEFDSLVDWTTSTAIRQGQATNHIQAICDGSTLALFVNGQRLDEIEDSTFAAGDIALTATTFEDVMTIVHFDDLVVRSP